MIIHIVKSNTNERPNKVLKNDFKLKPKYSNSFS